jgi:hypothetical protein
MKEIKRDKREGTKLRIERREVRERERERNSERSKGINREK